MNRRAFGFSLAGLAWPALSFAQGGRQQAAVQNRPPVAKTEAEKRILTVLDQMRAAGELFQAVPFDNGRMLRLADNVAMAEDYVNAITTDPQLDTVFFGRFAATLKKR
jgi:hypothetical protein